MSDLEIEDADGIRTITFNRPNARNALTSAMRLELCEALDHADRDENTRAIIITGTDPVFTGGVDFKEVDPSFDQRGQRFKVNPGSALRAMRTPAVCAVNGACVSGGLEIALSSTLIIASDRARFADTHARLNVVPTWGLTALLPRAVGLRKAREMSMTGNFVDAQEALRIGLVNHVVPHDELMTFTRDLVSQIANTPAVGEVLALYERGADLGFNAAVALESAGIGTRTFDPAAFTAAGRATAARQRHPS